MGFIPNVLARAANMVMLLPMLTALITVGVGVDALATDHEVRSKRNVKNPTPLTFQADGSFQISIFEDLHMGENAWEEWGPAHDLASVAVINSVLDKESPGLVVLNGDLVTGENIFLENNTACIDQIVNPLVARGLPWASTYGNHDYDFNISGEVILEAEKKLGDSRTSSMVHEPDAGVSNYYLPVYDNGCIDEQTCEPQLHLWFFDSRGGMRFQEKKDPGGQVDQEHLDNRVGQGDHVDISVVRWFQQTSAELMERYGKTIPSLGFVHIPTHATWAMREVGIDPNRQPGMDHDFVAPQTEGQDTEFMEAISQTPGLLALFSAHNHGNSWCSKWDKDLPKVSVKPANGITLCYGQHSGYGGYSNWERGSRQVLVSKEGLAKSEADTWIRLESGAIVDSVCLNSTFGQDYYPA